MTRLSVLLALSAVSGFAQTPPAPPLNATQPAPSAATAAAASSSSRISHVVSGPDGRPQGLLLRNGTFVSLSPSLSQQIPSNLRHNASVTVSGPAYGSGSGRTIQAQRVTIAGVSYKDAGGFGAGVAGAPLQLMARAGALLPPAGAPGITPPPPPPCGPGVPPPPPAVGPGTPPPPPPLGGKGSMVPPPAGRGAVPPAAGSAPPPPANSSRPAPPAQSDLNPATNQPSPAAQPVPQTPPPTQN